MLIKCALNKLCRNEFYSFEKLKSNFGVNNRTLFECRLISIEYEQAGSRDKVIGDVKIVRCTLKVCLLRFH